MLACLLKKHSLCKSLLFNWKYKGHPNFLGAKILEPKRTSRELSLCVRIQSKLQLGSTGTGIWDRCTAFLLDLPQILFFLQSHLCLTFRQLPFVVMAMSATPGGCGEAQSSVKWQLCYDVTAKTWWMVSLTSDS